MSLVCSFIFTGLSGVFITANSLKILDLNNNTSLSALPSATRLLIYVIHELHGVKSQLLILLKPKSIQRHEWSNGKADLSFFFSRLVKLREEAYCYESIEDLYQSERHVPKGSFKMLECILIGCPGLIKLEKSTKTFRTKHCLIFILSLIIIGILDRWSVNTLSINSSSSINLQSNCSFIFSHTLGNLKLLSTNVLWCFCVLPNWQNKDFFYPVLYDTAWLELWLSL